MPFRLNGKFSTDLAFSARSRAPWQPGASCRCRGQPSVNRHNQARHIACVDPQDLKRPVRAAQCGSTTLGSRPAPRQHPRHDLKSKTAVAGCQSGPSWRAFASTSAAHARARAPGSDRRLSASCSAMLRRAGRPGGGAGMANICTGGPITSRLGGA